jgi:hypothetical protein
LFSPWRNAGICRAISPGQEVVDALFRPETARRFRSEKTRSQAEWRDYRACWWDNDTASMAFGPVVRVLVSG